MKRNDEKTLKIAFRNFRVTDKHSDGQTDRPRDTPSYRDARTHLKNGNCQRPPLLSNFCAKQQVLSGQIMS